jgi:TetR/AcrR family transcriptional repressor of nem operon
LLFASKSFREDGLAWVGITELMKEAGRTVGGFYKHFKSRDGLMVEAVGSAQGMRKRQVDAAASGGPARAVPSALWQEISHAATSELALSLPGKFETTELVATLIRDTNEKDKGAVRSHAVLTYCTLIGAIGVARAVSDEQLSREILKTVVHCSHMWRQSDPDSWQMTAHLEVGTGGTSDPPVLRPPA